MMRKLVAAVVAVPFHDRVPFPCFVFAVVAIEQSRATVYDFQVWLDSFYPSNELNGWMEQRVEKVQG